MEKGGRSSKTFVSTFRLDLKPTSRRCVQKPKENGLDACKRAALGNSKLGITTSSDARQTPNQPRALEAPHFKEPLQDCSVREGSDVTFQGVITGSQPLSISWLHNGERVHSRRTSFTGGVARLTVCRCSSGDVGIYTCEAENAIGKKSSSAALRVTEKKEIAKPDNQRRSTSEPTTKELESRNTQCHFTSKGASPHREEKKKGGPVKKPLMWRVAGSIATDVSPQTKVSTNKGPPVEFLDPQEQVDVRVGQQARLHCVFTSSCVPVACCWIHNRERVVIEGPRTHVTSSETESSMEISQACPDDAGSYTVVVRNRRGSAQHTVSLCVIDRPHPPASQPVVSQLSSQSLVLSWTGPSYDGGTAVSGYVVEVRREGEGDWTEVTTRCKNTSHQVRSGLESLGEYRFRVRAYNSAGVSEPSEESDCIKMATTRGQKEEPHTYATVTIDTKHKVKDHYDVHERLGVGKFAQVFRLSHKETGQVCAGKFYRARSTKDKNAARKEIELMNCLHHPKLVQCLAGYDTRSEIVMVMEYIAGGELFERIVDENFEHTELTSARYIQQILEGMQYVHKQNIVHLDLKPENIICMDTTGTRIKIIDFGLARKLEPGNPLMVMHGTPEFVAPEVISYEPIGLETDMWSVGVICFILLSGESPFQGDGDADTLARVTTASYEFDEESFEDISEQAKEFIRSLLQKDMRCRLSCDEALAHPWMVTFTPLNRRPTKSLRKDKMRRFLAKRKWKKTGKAVLALQRMANLSNRPDSPGSHAEESSWSPEAEAAIQSLGEELQSEPRFQQALEDAAQPKGATAQLTCLVQGYPEPDVQWLLNGEPVGESSRVTVECYEDGLHSLVLTDLEASDSGVYMCRATNSLGAAVCSAKLTVEI